jgi:MFS family permease
MERIEVANNKSSSSLLHFIIYILFLLGPLTGNVILVLFGPLSNEFGVSPTSIALAIPAFMFPFAIVQLFSGAISDIKGRISVILFGLILFTIGMVVALLSISLEIYAFANVLGGIGFGFVNPVLIALISDISKGPEIPKKMGFLGAVANLGVGLGPILAGLLVVFGWRYLYWIFIGITILGFIILLLLNKSREKVINEGGLKTFLSHLIEEIRRPEVILLILSSFFATQSYLSIITWTSQALTGSIPANLAGIIIGFAGIFGAVAGFFIGLIIKIKGVKFAIVIGLIAQFISLIIFISIEDVTSMDMLVFVSLGFIFAGISGGSLLPAIMFYSQTLSHERRGALAGLSTAGQFIGIALVPIIYEPFFHQGGISLVYLIVLIISIIFLIIISMLYLVAKKST